MTLPRVRQHGAMTAIANKMGYARPTDIPDNRLDEYVHRLAVRYGERAARGMIQLQLNYRSGEGEDPAEGKFRKMMAALDRRYKGKGWTPPKRVKQKELDRG